MELVIRVTQRGFARADFADLYGEKCSIQESSLAFPPALWLGCNAGTHHLGECSARMHLDQAQVAALLPLLHHFVETGELPNKQPATAVCSVCQRTLPDSGFQDNVCLDCRH